ncbi:CASP-like protein 4A1 [Quercus suber]|uniref:CASP-like protein 4A1 n=1 Tax=Quercus suber TaxID=58331 RepID=UPI000CE175FA|nr:CASP-like protein 4A1 [Quercus suber]POE98103.1 casp-like protein 4a1 [Quercus suber]
MSINSDQKMDTKEEEEDHKEEEEEEDNEDDGVQKKETISDQSHHTIHGASPTQSHIDEEEEEEEAQGKYTISDPSSLSSPPQSHIDHKSTSPPKAYTPSSSVSSLCSNSNPSSPHTYSHEYKLSSAPNRTPPPKPLAPVANRSFKADPLVFTTSVDPEAQHGYTSVREVQEGVIVVDGGFGVDVGVGGGGGGGGRRLRPDPSILKKTRRDNNMMKKTFLGLRICAFVFCLISFSVMAADKQKGWALDSFYWYKEFRYCLAANVIGFVYSGLQLCDLVKYFTTGRHIIHHHFRRYFDFSMDQMLTYLLISASSSAATRVYVWQSNWGEDEFPKMAIASVGLSFVAFLAFALSSLICGYTLVKFHS